MLSDPLTRTGSKSPKQNSKNLLLIPVNYTYLFYCV